MYFTDLLDAETRVILLLIAAWHVTAAVARQNRVRARWAHVRARLRDSRMLETGRRQGLSAPSGCRPCPVRTRFSVEDRMAAGKK